MLSLFDPETTFLIPLSVRDAAPLRIIVSSSDTSASPRSHPSSLLCVAAPVGRCRRRCS